MPGRAWFLGLVCVGTVLTVAGCTAGAPARQPGPSSGPSSTPTAGSAPLSLDAILALNPAMNATGYALRPGPEPGLSLWAPKGAGQVELIVNAAKTVVAVRGVFPTSTGLEPWFDQAHGVTANAQTGAVPTPAPASRTAPYTIPSATAIPRASSATAAGQGDAPLVGGSAAATSGTSVATVYTETLWLVPRAQASGGPTSLPQYTGLAGLNPALSQAKALSRFVPGAGVYYGPREYGLVALADRGGRLVGVMGWFPVGAGWQPFYDQLPGHEDLVSHRLLKGFTQHVWLAAPSSLR